jgi:hypothetical protein
MNTVGYGDMTPQNPSEKMFVIVFVYVACGLFAYSLNSIGLILQDINKREEMFKKDIKIINGYMVKHNINSDLQTRVRKYFEYLWNEIQKQKTEEENQIINKLSDSLKEELLLEANGRLIKGLKMLALNFSDQALQKTVYILKEINFTPGDLIYNEGDTDEHSLYIIKKGN